MFLKVWQVQKLDPQKNPKTTTKGMFREIQMGRKI